MLFVPMTLRKKTQNRVLGRSAGVPCEVASGLRSHGFEAMIDDTGEKTIWLRSHGFGAMEDNAGKETMCQRSHGFEAMEDDSEAETMCRRSHGFGAMIDDTGEKTMWLRSHGFEAKANASGMMKKAVRHCDERHMLSGFREKEREDGMIAKNCALSDDEVAYRCNGTSKSSEVNAEREIVKSVENTDRCDESNECDSVNAMCGVSSDVEKANRGKNSCKNVGNASCELGTGGVECPSVESCEVQIVRRQSADCKLGTGGVECPSAKVDMMMNAKEQCISCELGTGGVVCPSAKIQALNEQRVSCESGVGGAVRPNATESDLWTNTL